MNFYLYMKAVCKQHSSHSNDYFNEKPAVFLWVATKHLQGCTGGQKLNGSNFGTGKC